ncbi:hypothetical protein AVEN_75593-1 [Araneus ventricosus]|uniref:Uncharacterized protein n=1 Tax=Araneus ventricosus TaxID=182803 RepID=A0A4Y2CKF4_ARAVE|nr:hypothetical protein AVEN_75593-1 [Araneus ventricosus]
MSTGFETGRSTDLATTRQILFQNYGSESVILNRNQQFRIRGIRVNPIPIHESDSADSSRIRFRVFIVNPIPRIRRIRSFCSESDPVVPFEDPDPRIRSGVNDSSLHSTPY